MDISFLLVIGRSKWHGDSVHAQWRPNTLAWGRATKANGFPQDCSLVKALWRDDEALLQLPARDFVPARKENFGQTSKAMTVGAAADRALIRRSRGSPLGRDGELRQPLLLTRIEAHPIDALPRREAPVHL
jgi:hypothetical protein